MAHTRPKAGAVKFFFTMNMQSRSGNPTHQVIGEVQGISSLDRLIEVLQDQEFLLIEEFYKDPQGGYYSRGMTVLNTMHIGKIKIDT